MELTAEFLKEIVHTYINASADLENARIISASKNTRVMRFPIIPGYRTYEDVELQKIVYNLEAFYIGYGPINNVIVVRQSVV